MFPLISENLEKVLELIKKNAIVNSNQQEHEHYYIDGSRVTDHNNIHHFREETEIVELWLAAILYGLVQKTKHK